MVDWKAALQPLDSMRYLANVLNRALKLADSFAIKGPIL